MPLWNSRRRGKPRNPSRVSAYFSEARYQTQNEHGDLSTLHGYGPQSPGSVRARNFSAVQPLTRYNDERVPNSPKDELHMGGVAPLAGLHPGLMPAADVGRSTASGRSSKHADGHNDMNIAPSSNGLWSWIPHITQSTDDATISRRIREVFVFTEQFINNFYVDRPDTGNISEAVIEKINRSQLLSTNRLQTYLNEADFQTPLITHVLISLLLDLISFDSMTSQRSLLPKEYQNYTTLAIARTRNSTSDEEIPHIQPALSSYRVLTAYIHPNIDTDPQYIDEKQHVSNEVIAHFEPAFKPWFQDSSKQEQWSTAFRQLLEKTANLGIFLFSQPSVFFFDWEMMAEDESAGLIPVSPRVLRVFDNEAQLKVVADHLVAIKCAKVVEDKEDEWWDE